MFDTAWASGRGDVMDLNGIEKFYYKRLLSLLARALLTTRDVRRRPFVPSWSTTRPSSIRKANSSFVQTHQTHSSSNLLHIDMTVRFFIATGIVNPAPATCRSQVCKNVSIFTKAFQTAFRSPCGWAGDSQNLEEQRQLMPSSRSIRNMERHSAWRPTHLAIQWIWFFHFHSCLVWRKCIVRSFLHRAWPWATWTAKKKPMSWCGRRVHCVKGISERKVGRWFHVPKE